MAVRQRPARSAAPCALASASTERYSSSALRYCPERRSWYASFKRGGTRSCSARSWEDGLKSRAFLVGPVRSTVPTPATMRAKQTMLLVFLIHASRLVRVWGRPGSLREYYIANTPREAYQSLPKLWQFYFVLKRCRAPLCAPKCFGFKPDQRAVGGGVMIIGSVI